MADTPQYKQSQGMGKASNIVSPTEVNSTKKERGPVPKGPKSVKRGDTNKKNRLQMILQGLRGARG